MSDDDAILKQLGARVREERAEKSAAAGVPAFDEAAEERIAARLLGPNANTNAKPKKDGGGVVVRPARWMWAAGPLAAAAAIALFVATRGGGSSALPPSYELSFTSASQVRDPSAPKPKELAVDPDGELELVARPAVPVKGVAVRAVLVGPGGPQLWTAPFEVSDEGAVRVAGPTRSLFPVASGSCEIMLFIGVGEAVPSGAEAIRIASSSVPESARYRVVRTTVRFIEKK